MVPNNTSWIKLNHTVTNYIKALLYKDVKTEFIV